VNDNEIVKALECCMGMIEGECEECPMCNKEYCKDALMGYSRNLINRLQADQEALINGQESLQKYIADLQAEIERLQGVIDSFTDIGKLYSEIKSEARKEFAERLKEDFDTYPDEEELMALYMINLIDNLLAEMNGKEKL
jgi:hypothetical protein